MKEKELIHYRFGEPDEQAEDWMERIRKKALDHFKQQENVDAAYWVLVGGKSGMPANVISASADRSLLSLVDKKTRTMYLTVDAIGRIRLYLAASPGLSCYVVSLHDKTTTGKVNVLTSFADTPARGAIEKAKMYMDTYTHRHVHADWLGELIELPREEPHIIQDALGQFW